MVLKSHGYSRATSLVLDIPIGGGLIGSFKELAQIAGAIRQKPDIGADRQEIDPFSDALLGVIW